MTTNQAAATNPPTTSPQPSLSHRRMAIRSCALRLSVTTQLLMEFRVLERGGEWADEASVR